MARVILLEEASLRLVWETVSAAKLFGTFGYDEIERQQRRSKMSKLRQIILSLSSVAVVLLPIASSVYFDGLDFAEDIAYYIYQYWL